MGQSDQPSRRELPLFDFDYRHDGVLYEATWSPIDAELFAPRWTGLYEEYGSDEQANPRLTYAINNGFGEAALAVRLLAWALTEGRDRAVIPSYYRDEAARELGRSAESTDFVRWQYEVGCDYRDPARGDIGFVEGRAGVPIRPKPTEFQAAHAGEAGVFRIDSFEQLTKVHLAVSGDASSEVSVFGLHASQERFSDLLAGLRLERRPSLDDLLAEGELLVHTGLDHDGFGLSSMVVKSPTDFEALLGAVTQRVGSAFDAYLRAVPSVNAWPDWFAAVETMERAALSPLR